ncbi:MAG: hypothetical protein LBI28_01475 [Treponema sp.]|nr:hypothetical protein [Treponema sp.]
MDEPKSKSPEIERTNIFIIETYENFKRLAVQINDVNDIENLVVNYINSIEGNIKILIKIFEKYDNEKKDSICKRFYGETTKEKLLDGIKQYHDFIFHDGYSEFLIKNTTTNEYICLDEYGFLFYYLNEFDNIIMDLKNMDIKEVSSYENFISNYFCYRMELLDQETYIKKFVEEYNLKYVEKPYKDILYCT